MPTGYHHLAYTERCQIHALLHRGFSQREIAVQLERDPGTISREISRNRGKCGYRHKQAQGKATSRLREASEVPRKMTPDRWEVVEEQLEEGWSPEQISGRYRRLGKVMACREWIYQHVRANRHAGGTLYKHLRRRDKKPNWKGGRHAGRGHIPGRVDISERPAVVEEKSRIGDWELDTIIGSKHRGALVSSVDRHSKYALLEQVDRKTADSVAEVLTRRMMPFRDQVHTLTADNGKEFAGHQVVSKALAADFYFAAPYHSWERGLNEHTNGLVRQYCPKGTNFRKVTEEQVQAVEDRINHRPRKILGYRTPAEVFTGARSPP